MSELALKLIAENKRKHAAGEDATFLDLGNCGLKDELPKELFDCYWLLGLNMGAAYFNPQVGRYQRSFNKGASNLLKNSSLRSIKTLSKLQSLFIFDNPITDISPLNNLRRLISLSIGYNKVIDISPLANLGALRSLVISHNRIVDLSPLKNLSSLNSLDIGSNNIIDVSPIGYLDALVSLDIGYNRITDMSPLANLRALKSLTLVNNSIIDISPLAALDSLTYLDVSDNLITDLSPIASMSELGSLDITRNPVANLTPLVNLKALKRFYLIHNQMADLSPLANLLGLNVMYLTGNQIADLSPLANLVSLETLHLHQNRVTDLSPLANLASLATLTLSDNQITDLSPLTALTSLKELDTSNNQINYFDDSFASRWRSLERLKLSGNVIRNIPKAISELENCLRSLKDYLKDKKRDLVPVYESKLLLIGNGRVGKTCLVKRMLDNTFDAKEKSTHAIQLRQWSLNDLAKDSELDEISLNIWDFGGQDIYHATHRMFMRTDALFLLVWDAETEGTLRQKELLPGGKVISYTNHRLKYWLSYIKVLSNDSPVIIVQTKMGAGGEKSTGLSKEELKEFNVLYTLSVESSKRVFNGFATLEEMINITIQQRIKTVCTALPMQWYRVRQEIAQLQKNGIKSITFHHFKTLCEHYELDKSSTKTLLEYFHNIGVAFYQRGLFRNQLIIDQKWAIDAVYALFDRRGSFTRLHGSGIFTGEDLQDIWKGKYRTEEQGLFIDFMLRCEICFEIGNYSRKRLIERKFIAPQLLPENIPIGTEASIRSAFYESESIYIKYRHNFLHNAVIQRFIVHTGFIADSKEMWQSGVLLRPEDGVAVVESDAEKNEITIRVKNGNMLLMDKICNELKEITKDEKGVESYCSFDGEDYVSTEKLRKNPPEIEIIETINGKWVLAQPYRAFLNPNENIRFEKTTPPKNNMMDKPKIFFSYAWNKDSDDMVTKLYDSLKNDGYIVVRDKNDLGYKGLISEFMQNIGRGEFVVVAISDKYLTSENCMYELSELYRNSKMEKAEFLKKIYPIRIESLKLSDSKVRIGYYTFWEEREKELQDTVVNQRAEYRKLEQINEINMSIRKLLPILDDINSSTKENLSENNFAMIKNAIKDRLQNQSV